MKKKLKNTVFEYSSNSRITTKELGRKTNSSQQSASYLLKTLKSRKIVKNETLVVDAVKLGYINTFIGFNYIKLDYQSQKDVVSELKSTKEIIGIEESTEGFDLLIEFSTRTLAAMNKVHTKLMYKLDKMIKTSFIFPVITKYKYPRKYLKQIRNIKTKILFEDKRVAKLSNNELTVLKALVRNPREKTVALSEETKINIKTVLNIRRGLEKKFVIRGYGVVFDNRKLGINRQIIFLRFSGEGLRGINKFVEFGKGHKNIIEISRVIGSSQIVVIVESLNEIEIVKEIRSLFPIEDYMIFKSSEIHKKTYLPRE